VGGLLRTHHYHHYLTPILHHSLRVHRGTLRLRSLRQPLPRKVRLVFCGDMHELANSHPRNRWHALLPCVECERNGNHQILRRTHPLPDEHVQDGVGVDHRHDSHVLSGRRPQLSAGVEGFGGQPRKGSGVCVHHNGDTDLQQADFQQLSQ
jgi:hypothetical protein